MAGACDPTPTSKSLDSSPGPEHSSRVRPGAHPGQQPPLSYKEGHRQLSMSRAALEQGPGLGILGVPRASQGKAP